jgi:hypothetical protein
MASEIDKQFDEWISSSENAGDLVLLENENGKVTFLYREEEFYLHYPKDFPNSSTRLVMTSSFKLMITKMKL